MRCAMSHLSTVIPRLARDKGQRLDSRTCFPASPWVGPTTMEPSHREVSPLVKRELRARQDSDGRPDAARRLFPQHSTRNLPTVKAAARGRESAQQRLWPPKCYGSAVIRNYLDWPPPRPQELLSGIGLAVYEALKFAVLALVAFVALPVIAWAESSRLAVWRRLLLALWGFLCGIATLVWLPLWGVVLAVAILLWGLASTLRAIYEWHRRSVWDPVRGAWLRVDTPPSDPPRRTPTATPERSGPSVLALEPSRPPPAPRDPWSFALDPFPTPSPAFPLSTASREDTEAQCLKKLGVPPGTSTDLARHAMYRRGWDIREEPGFSLRALDDVADALAVLQHLRTGATVQAGGGHPAPGAVLSELLGCAAVGPVLGELRVVTASRVQGQLAGAASKGLGSGPDPDVVFETAVELRQRRRCIGAAARLVGMLEEFREAVREAEDVDEDGGGDAAAALAPGVAAWDGRVEAMCEAACPSGAGAAQVPAVRGQVLRALGRGLVGAAEVLMGRVAPARWLGSRLSFAWREVAWGWRRFWLERRMSQLQDEMDEMERDEAENARLREGDPLRVARERPGGAAGKAMDEEVSASLPSTSAVSTEEAACMIVGEPGAADDVDDHVASVNVRRRALEAEALTLMMGAAWESVEEDIWKTTRCVGLLAGAGWTPESSPSPGQSSQPRPVDAVRRERARAMLRMGRQMVRWAEEWLGAAEAAAEGLRAHAESPLATSHHVAQAIKVSAERAVASG